MAQKRSDLLSQGQRWEQLKYVEAAQEIRGDCRRQETESVKERTENRVLDSGLLTQDIVRIGRSEARRLLDAKIDIRRDAIQKCRELGTSDKLHEIVVWAGDVAKNGEKSIRDRIKQLSGRDSPYSRENSEGFVLSLVSEAARKVEVLKVEMSLEDSNQSKPQESASPDKDPKKVWVVHGRNLKARDAMFRFLESLGLEPIDWGEALAQTGKGSPSISEVIKGPFKTAQAYVILFTGDDEVRLDQRLWGDDDEGDEEGPAPQARPNVIFEAGMAFATDSARTIFVRLGKVSLFSDVSGHYIVGISNDVKRRTELATLLKSVGCAVDIENRISWHDAGDFDDAVLTPIEPPEKTASDNQAAKLAVSNTSEASLAHLVPTLEPPEPSGARGGVRGYLRLTNTGSDIALQVKVTVGDQPVRQHPAFAVFGYQCNKVAARGHFDFPMVWAGDTPLPPYEVTVSWVDRNGVTGENSGSVS